MARYKKIYEDEQRKQMKKQHKIRTIVNTALVIFWIVAICIGGAFQHNDTVVGLVAIAVGVANTAYSLFAFRIRRLGWKTMTVYDSDELYRHKSSYFQKQAEQESESLELKMLIVNVLIAGFAAACFVMGALKLI